MVEEIAVMNENHFLWKTANADREGNDQKEKPPGLCSKFHNLPTSLNLHVVTSVADKIIYYLFWIASERRTWTKW